MQTSTGHAVGIVDHLTIVVSNGIRGNVPTGQALDGGGSEG